MNFISIQNRRIEYQLLRAANSDAPVMVLLHEGLGSLAMWKDFPRQVAHAAGCNVLVYSRYGYGQSDPLRAPRRVDFMHDEALNALPELLDKLGIEKPLLFGHSDGGSIALIHAGGSGRSVAGVIAMAPHVLVEDISISSIQAAKHTYQTTDLRDKLARYHGDPDSAFWGWNDIWLHPEFRAWNIEEFLPRIACPLLAIQGEDDEYGTLEQIERIARLAPDVDLLKLTDCRHSPHRDQPAAVIEAVTRFVDRIR
ncbi:MAG: alpha/beta fold hydrolase [Burkholderiales bacterium]